MSSKPENPDIALHCLVSGRVQGVWFRQSTKETAEANGLRGWVRNLPDGRVEALLCGQPRAVNLVEAWLNQGPELANVAEVASQSVAVPDDLQGFEIR